MTEHQNQRPTINVEACTEAVQPPIYFPVSSLKLVVMSLCTFGIYEIYWFYKNWCIVQERERLDIIPFGRAFFAYFFCYSLFKKIQVTAETQQTRTSIDPGPLAAGWIVLTFLWKLPDPYWLITFFAVFFLVPAQMAVNEINAVVSPKHDSNRKFTGWNILGVVIGGPLFVLVLIGTFFPPK